jgi:prepilin-type N-terminal cleavage/methylation domain-containing protein
MRRRAGFSLIEVLVSVLLLSLCLVAMTSLYGVSRKITERSRDTGEYYAVARQEAERLRSAGYTAIFDQGIPSGGSYTYYNPNTGATTYLPQYYDVTGAHLGTSAGTTGYYKVTSTFSVIIVTGELQSQKVGVHQISVALVSAPGTPVYTTTIFFSPAGA